MNIVETQLDELVEKLERTKSYLCKKSEPGINYSELIEQINSKIIFLEKNSRLVVKLVSTSKNIVLKLKAKSEADYNLRSLYNFEAVSPFRNFSEIVSNCDAIFLIFQSDKIITKHQYKLIKLAKKKKVSLFISIEQSINSSSTTLSHYIKSQDYTDIEEYLFLKDSFFELDNIIHIELFQQFLTNAATKLKEKFVRNNVREIINSVNLFFSHKKTKNWQKIEQIKQTYLEKREVNNYQQQVLTKIFNKLERQQQQKVLSIKQAINQSRSYYTNPFICDSWMFELQELIERSQIKLVKDKTETYLYLVVENDKCYEYLHSYVLNLFQERVTKALKSQWSKINYIYTEGGLEAWVVEANHKIASITLLNNFEIEKNKIIFNLEPLPEININNIVDFQSFRANSKIVFDYNYTQSSWFKLLIFGSIGIAIYLITKIYFGTGRYIGFVILVFQIINIFTGQSIKKLKLKSHKKELQRNVSSKYQILIRLIVEQMTQTLITSLEQKSNQYLIQINAISNLAYQKLDTIKQNVNQHQSIKNKLDRDKAKIISFLS